MGEQVIRQSKFFPIKEKELIILGMGNSRRFCPWDAEVWSCNTGYIQVAEMHGHLKKIFLSHEQHKKRFKDGKLHDVYRLSDFNYLTEHGVDIYNIHRMKGIKHKMYPLKRLIKKFNTGFFSNTICYMLVYAIDKCTTIKDGRVVLKRNPPYRKIRFYGVDMMTKDEYELEKGGIEYWIGFARGLGLEVTISEGSTLTKTCTNRPYGIKFFNLRDIDPWGLFKAGKKRLWEGQAMLKIDEKKLAEFTSSELDAMTKT